MVTVKRNQQGCNFALRTSYAGDLRSNFLLFHLEIPMVRIESLNGENTMLRSFEIIIRSRIVEFKNGLDYNFKTSQGHCYLCPATYRRRLHSWKFETHFIGLCSIGSQNDSLKFLEIIYKIKKSPINIGK